MTKFKKGDKAICLKKCGIILPGQTVIIDENDSRYPYATVLGGKQTAINEDNFVHITAPTLDPIAYIKSRLDALKDPGGSVEASAMQTLLINILQHGHGITARLETTRAWVFEDAAKGDGT